MCCMQYLHVIGRAALQQACQLLAHCFRVSSAGSHPGAAGGAAALSAGAVAGSLGLLWPGWVCWVHGSQAGGNPAVCPNRSKPRGSLTDHLQIGCPRADDMVLMVVQCLGRDRHLLKSWPKLKEMLKRLSYTCEPLEPPCTITRPPAKLQAWRCLPARLAPTPGRRCQQKEEVFRT